MLPNLKRPKKQIYLDNAAATEIDPVVLKDMLPFLKGAFGNPSSLYKQGREAKEIIDVARRNIANILSCSAKEIIFTAGGTESCNLAIFGVARNYGEPSAEKSGKPHIIISAIEHHAVFNPAKVLEGEGYALTILPVDGNGFVDVKNLQKSIRPETILVSVMYANNEIGTVEPIEEIGKLLKQINTDRLKNRLTRIAFHTDACQAAGSLGLDVNHLGVDLMSVNGSKIYGPKQTGFLYARGGINLKPLIYGGGQERNLRSGTENVAGIVGLAKALDLVQKISESENQRIGKLQQYFISMLVKIKGVSVNGPQADGVHRLVNNISVTVKGVEGETLMLYLDSYNIAVSTGSACTTGNGDASHVLLALGRSKAEARSALRLSLGKVTSKSEIDHVVKVIASLVPELRKVKGLREN